MYSSYCPFFTLYQNIVCVCVLCACYELSVSIVQCPLPSLKEKADRSLTSIDIHVLNNGVDSNTGLSRGAQPGLDWLAHSDQTALLDQSEDSDTSFLYKQNHFRMDDLYVQCEYVKYAIVSVVRVGGLGLLPLPAAPGC